tara:strand:- start:325 stop:507 length:183 start_codon:yes stop_codon:yes gene_type:complete
MLLYLEEQLKNAYLVYCDSIPEGYDVMDVEDFRETVENDEELFEMLLAEHAKRKAEFQVH